MADKDRPVQQNLGSNATFTKERFDDPSASSASESKDRDALSDLLDHHRRERAARASMKVYEALSLLHRRLAGPA